VTALLTTPVTTALNTALHSVLTIPSPSQGVWHIGPVPIRAYALCIIAGIIVAIIISERRWKARGGRVGDIQDLALWAVPFGLVGGRLYHVITDNDLYFGEGKNPITALYVWRGGLGIWGAIALGAVGVYIGCRQKGIKMLPAVDTLAPGVVVAQAIGRWGNYFNQELYGRKTDLPWKLEITKDPQGFATAPTYHHPTFLYECIWDLGVFGLLIWAERRFKLGFGRVMALYIMGYTAGRAWIEDLRVDKVQMNDVFGLRLNVWTSIVLFIVGAVWFWWSARKHPGREETVYVEGREPADTDSEGAAVVMAGVAGEVAGEVDEKSDPGFDMAGEVPGEPVSELAAEVPGEGVNLETDEVSDEPTDDLPTEALPGEAVEATDEPAVETSDEVEDESLHDVVEEPAHEPIDEEPDEPVRDVADETTDEVSDDVADAPADEPTDEVSDDSTDDEVEAVTDEEPEDAVAEVDDAVADEEAVEASEPAEPVEDTTEADAPDADGSAEPEPANQEK
jgi:prolipoprotein diacylglyceryl transferase